MIASFSSHQIKETLNPVQLLENSLKFIYLIVLAKNNNAGISLYRANNALTNCRKLKIVGNNVADSENCNN